MSFNSYYIRSAEFPLSSGGGLGEVTRQNYEEYFLLYVDNELTAEARKAVEVFVQQNPDLEEELIMLQQSVLKPEQMMFDAKDRLLKDTAAQGPVNEGNYEEYFVLYGDDELTNAEKDLVEQFVYKHPQYQAEFELIQQVKLVPDQSLTFPDKVYLYRSEEEENKKVIPFPWMRMSAAAVVLLMAGSIGWYVSTVNNRQGTTARATDRQQTPVKNNMPAQPARNEVAVYTPNSSTGKTEATTTPAMQPDNEPVYAVVTNKNAGGKTLVPNKGQKNISAGSNIQPAVNVLPQTTDAIMNVNSNEDKVVYSRPVQVPVSNAVGAPAVNAALAHKSIGEPVKVINAVSTLNDETGEDANGKKYAIAAVTVNKTPLRGFFRKVSRVVDRVTNPDENAKGVRIANFEIALQ